MRAPAGDNSTIWEKVSQQFTNFKEFHTIQLCNFIWLQSILSWWNSNKFLHKQIVIFYKKLIEWCYGVKRIRSFCRTWPCLYDRADIAMLGFKKRSSAWLSMLSKGCKNCLHQAFVKPQTESLLFNALQKIQWPQILTLYLHMSVVRG